MRTSLLIAGVNCVTATRIPIHEQHVRQGYSWQGCDGWFSRLNASFDALARFGGKPL